MNGVLVLGVLAAPLTLVALAILVMVFLAAHVVKLQKESMIEALTNSMHNIQENKSTMNVFNCVNVLDYCVARVMHITCNRLYQFAL